MAHSSSTTNYNLPQFAPTDKPGWLTDVNAGYLAIDTAIKNVSDTADAAQADATQAGEDATQAITDASAANAKGSGAVASFASTFSNTNTYPVDSIVMYNNLLYICIAAVTTPGDWTGSTNWSRATVESLNAVINNRLANLEESTEESAWQDISLTSGFTNIVDKQSQYKTKGDVIYFNLEVEAAANPTWGTHIGWLGHSHYEACFAGRYGNGIAIISIQTNGNILFLASTNTSQTDRRLVVYGSYIYEQ